jgi:outer membrane protein OmpA-like peptidoglycan-associated protein
MTRTSIFFSTAILLAMTLPQPSLSAAAEDAVRLAQAAPPAAAPADDKDKDKNKRPQGQRPAQGTQPAQQQRPPAANAPPNKGAPTTAQPAPQQPQRPGTPPAAAQTPLNQAPHLTPPAQAQTPPGQPPHVAPPAAAQTPQAPHVAPPAQAQTPPGQPPHVAPPAAAQAPANQLPHVAPPATAQTPPGQQPVRPGAPALPNAAPPALANPILTPRPPQAPAPAAQAPLAPAHPLAPAAIANAPVDPRTMPQHLDQLRSQRQQTQEGNQTVIREADRVIIREGGHDIIRHDEAGRFRFNAREVNTERRGNDTVTVVLRPDGARIITEVDETGRLLRRVRRDAAGREVIIIDNTFEPRGPGVAGFFVELPPPVVRVPRELYIRETARASAEDIFLTLLAPPVDRIERRYALDEIRYSEPLRARMPRVDIDTVNFDLGSWEITPDQTDRLAFVGQGIMRAVQRNPREVFMVEGYTDATGNDVDNLSLSDRRAESVAVMLTNQFGVPPENLTTQGYGKQFLKIPTEAPERANRRVAVRRITPLLMGQN